MIPLLAALTFPPPDASGGPTGSLTLAFGAEGVVTASMGEGGAATLTVRYYAVADAYDYLEITAVSTTYPAGVVCVGYSLTPTPPNTTDGFTAFSPGYAGVGDYVFTARVRRVASGLFDVASNEITLTVS